MLIRIWFVILPSGVDFRVARNKNQDKNMIYDVINHYLCDIVEVEKEHYMPKLSDAAEKAPTGAKMTSLKIDPKTRYLADLASTATGQSLTRYIESALKESFKKVTLRVPPDPEPMYRGTSGNYEVTPIDLKEEEAKREAMTIANLADLLWSESEFSRIQSLYVLAGRLLSPEDSALFEYIHNRKDLQIPSGEGYKLNRAKIDNEWESIKAEFAKRGKKGGKA